MSVECLTEAQLVLLFYFRLVTPVQILKIKYSHRPKSVTFLDISFLKNVTLFGRRRYLINLPSEYVVAVDFEAFRTSLVNCRVFLVLRLRSLRNLRSLRLLRFCFDLLT